MTKMNWVSIKKTPKQNNKNKSDELLLYCEWGIVVAYLEEKEWIGKYLEDCINDPIFYMEIPKKNNKRWKNIKSKKPIQNYNKNREMLLSDEVLIMCEHGALIATYNDSFWRGVFCIERIRMITHWMESPEIPKGGEYKRI